MARFSDDKDRLTSLPDDILTRNILPLLSLKEAARTSILARPWRFLWLYLPGLDFDARTRPYREKISFRGEGGSKYAQWVDQVIGAYRGTTTLSHFRLVFRLDQYTFSRKIDSWLMFSLTKGVEVLELDCYSECFYGMFRYNFPSIQLHRFPNIRLLKSLTLKGLTVKNRFLKRFLRECESLERLQLHDLKSLTRISISGAASRLKSIDISRCSSLKSIMILAPTPDLVSLTYPVFVKSLHVEHAPQLADLFIGQNTGWLDEDFELISHPLFRYVPQLEALHLQINYWDSAINSYNLPELSHLKHLKMTLNRHQDVNHGCTYGVWSSLLKAIPCLQRLTVELYPPGAQVGQMVGKVTAKFANSFRLRHLRVLEITGFEGRWEECDLALWLIKGAAASLEKLIIDSRRGSSPWEYICRRYGIRGDEKVRAGLEQCAKRVFEARLPSKAELVLLV